VALTRISLTIAADLVRKLDRKAKELDRSRSWVIAEAVRRYLDPVASTPRAHPRAVREPAPVPYQAAGEVAAARRLHLASELRLTPAERLRRSEDLTGLAIRGRTRTARDQVIGFTSYEDYYQWKKARLVGA